MGKPTTDDYTAIRMVAERYVDAVNRFDPDAWISCWAPDGVWQTMEAREGREKILESWMAAMTRLPNVYMHVYSGVVDDVTGDQASGRWYMGEYLNMPDGSRSMNSICYVDTYTRIDGQWHIQTRRFDALYRGPADLSGEFSKLDG